MMRRVCWAWPGWRWSVSRSRRLGVRIVQLVTDDPDAARCPACRVVSTSGKDWVLTRPHDLPCGGGQVAVQWRKRRWRCRTAGLCAAVVHRAGRPGAGRDADHDQAADRARGGGRGRPGSVRGRRGARGVVADGAARGGRARARSSWSSRSRCGCWAWTRPGSGGRGGCPTGTHDDGRIRWRRTDPWETGFVDITGEQALLGQVDGRTSAAVQAWLAARTRGVPGRDRGGGDRPARRLRRRGPRGAARRRDRGGPLPPDHAREQGGDRGAPARHPRPARPSRPQDRPDVGEPAAAAARPGAALRSAALARMWNGCVDHDPTGQILSAWIAKEELRALCATAARGGHRHEIRDRL